MASQPPSQLQKSAAEDKPSPQEKPVAKTPELLPSTALPENSESKKKPAGAVSLFGGINVLDGKQTKSPLDEDDNNDSLLSKDSSPPSVKKEEKKEQKKEEKVKTKTVSLFEDEEEDESDWNDPIFTPSKPTGRNTLKVCMIYSKPKNSLNILFLLQSRY